MSEEEIKILDNSFKPENVHDHFMKLTELYHPSGEEDSVRKYVVECINKLHNIELVLYEPDATDPGNRVIVCRRKGSGDYANADYITLQAHMDMVCSPTKDIFPLHVFGYSINNVPKWIKALDKEGSSDPKKYITDSKRGTTLGADDGIGVATILALLEDPDLEKYPIECLFTVQEETDMGGAADFDKSLLIGRRYINLDAEDIKTIICGSAAAQNVQFEGIVKLVPVETDFTTMELSISGLLGGHSGVNINDGRLNSIKIITEALIRLNKRLTNLDGTVGKGISSYDLRLISLNSLKKDEIKSKSPVVNKIPTWIVARIAIPHSEKDNFKNDFNAYIAALKVQVPEETNLEFYVEEVSFEDVISFQDSLDEQSTDALLCLLRQIPHGIIRMIPEITNVVETSSNLAAVNSFGLKNDKIIIKALNRSSNKNSLDELAQIQEIIGKLFNYEVNVKDPSPIWQPQFDSDLVKKAVSAYNEAHLDCKAIVIHAGLECGYIADYFNGKIECISIGPTIMYPHTGGEKLNTDTVEPFYNAISFLIKELFPK